MLNFKISSPIFFTALLCICNLNLNAQTIKLLSYPELKPLVGLSITDVSKKTIKTNTNGEVQLEVVDMGKLQLSYVGYITQIINKPKRDTVVMMLPHTMLLDEVVIQPPKEKILGHFGKRGNGTMRSGALPERNLTAVNRIVIEKETKLKSFLFYILKDKYEMKNVPFEFVLFKRVDNQFVELKEKTPIVIDKYDYRWNSFSLEEHQINLEPGTYYFGMRWLNKLAPQYTYDVKISKSTTIKSFGPAMSTISSTNEQVLSYFHTSRFGWVKSKPDNNFYVSFTMGLIVVN